MNGQSLDTVSSVSRRIWSATKSRGGGAPTDALWSSALSTVVSAVSTTSVLSCTMSATCSPDHTGQSLPEPQELGGNSTGLPTNPSATASDSVPTRTPAAGSARNTRSSHTGPSYHQWPNSSVSNAAIDVRGPADAFALGGQPPAHHLDEVGDVPVDGMVSALGVVGRLVVRRHVAAGDPGRLEPGDVVVGVEVAVGGVAGIAGLRRPHPVADLQIASERDDVGVADRAAQRGVAVQRRTVDHEVPDTGGGVVVLHAGRVCAFRRPDACRRVSQPLLGVGQTLAQRELPQPRIEQRLERMRQRAAEQLDGVAVDQLAQQRAAAVPPQRGVVVERTVGLGYLTKTELAQRFPQGGCLLGRAAASWPASDACPSGSTGRRVVR